MVLVVSRTIGLSIGVVGGINRVAAPYAIVQSDWEGIGRHLIDHRPKVSLITGLRLLGQHSEDMGVEYCGRSELDIHI